ncbi:MAG: hypothetical protein H6867_00515 [Rhodospirillales bacterium]|nr:hypothetical protein [Rhodospirillales bacterium]MCB9996859.1 hypothetical protein [Rhodospirillales bacterium]
MVMFRDDEKKIREMEKAEKIARRGPLGRWIRRLIKAGFVLALIMGVSLGLLASLSGNNPALKKGIEDYMSHATGLYAEIETFNNMAFFPNLAIDAEGIKLRAGEAGVPVISVGTLQFSTGFFDLMFSRRRIGFLLAENITVEPGVLDSRRLVIDRAALEKDAGEGRAAFVASGHWGDKALKAHMDMDLETKSEDDLVFHFPDQGNFKLSLGAFKATGYTTQASMLGGVKMHFDTLGLDDNAMSGDIIIKRSGARNHVEADMHYGDSRIKADLRTKYGEMDGEISFPLLQLDDIGRLYDLYIAFLGHTAVYKTPPPVDLSGRDYDVTVRIEDLRSGKAALGQMNIPVRIVDQVLKTGPLDGVFSGGALSGSLKIDASGKTSTLNLKGGMKNWDYAALQAALHDSPAMTGGKANVHWNLDSSGVSFDDLWAGLSGEIVMIGGKGEFASKALNIWGAGLLNAMIPSLEPDSLTAMNCLIGDFKVEKSIAKPQPLFMDTARLTVVGEGSIDLNKMLVDLKLEPKAKNPALLDVATAVRVKGDLTRPKIETDSFSLFEKIGGLALGIVNPAFLAFSLTDLGLTESHPCHEFIGKPEARAPAEPDPLKERGALNE